jgi:hypothetical protein
VLSTVLLATGVARAAVASELSQLAVSAAPAGYVEVTDGSAVSGDLTLDEFAQATGQTITGVSAADRAKIALFARTWDAADGSRLFLLLVQTPSAADAADFYQGVLDSAGSAGYPTGVAGTVGRIVKAAQPVRLIVWHQGHYSVQVLSAAPTDDAAVAAAKELATAQVALLMPKGKPGEDVDHAPDFAYIAGGMVGVAAIVGIVLAVNARSNKRRRAAVAPWTGLPVQPIGRPPASWQQGPPPPPIPLQTPWQHDAPPPPPPPPA